jgi:hypothetical protein
VIVAELIEKLQALPPGSSVEIRTRCHGCYGEPTEVFAQTNGDVVITDIPVEE